MILQACVRGGLSAGAEEVVAVGHRPFNHNWRKGFRKYSQLLRHLLAKFQAAPTKLTAGFGEGRRGHLGWSPDKERMASDTVRAGMLEVRGESCAYIFPDGASRRC